MDGSGICILGILFFFFFLHLFSPLFLIENERERERREGKKGVGLLERNKMKGLGEVRGERVYFLRKRISFIGRAYVESVFYLFIF
jgi:hypothetical protein